MHDKFWTYFYISTCHKKSDSKLIKLLNDKNAVQSTDMRSSHDNKEFCAAILTDLPKVLTVSVTISSLLN